jgi:hypothetical protein
MVANIEISLRILSLNLNNAAKPNTARHTANQSGLKSTAFGKKNSLPKTHPKCDAGASRSNYAASSSSTVGQ